MEKKFLLITLILGSLWANAQYNRDTVIAGWMRTWYVLNFDNPNPALIEFEPPENNVWQIGKPQKEPFTPFNGTGAIMTDTAKMLDSTLEHSFILKFHRLDESNAVRDWWVQFMHNYEFDSLESGGYISVSYDKGAIWKNVVYDDYLYDDSTGSMAMLNLLYDSSSAKIKTQPALTGSDASLAGHPSSVGKHFSCTIWDAVLVHDIWVKFTYINTGKGNAHAGWMIDDLSFYIDTWCEYVYDGVDIDDNNNSEIRIYPNPSANSVSLTYPETGIEGLKLEVYDISGHMVLKRTGLCGTTENIDISALPNGFYFYRLFNSSVSYLGRFAKQI